jgi:hypothetical protein
MAKRESKLTASLQLTVQHTVTPRSSSEVAHSLNIKTSTQSQSASSATLSGWTWNVGTSNDSVAELALWLWVLVLILSEWATSDDDLGVTVCWTVSWRDAVNFDSLFAIF